MADINLVPQEIKVEQQRTQVVKRTTLVALIFALIVGLISAYLIFQSQSIKSQISKLNSSINSLRGDINGLSEIEVSARNLEMKSKTVDSVLASRMYYSMLLEKFKEKIPPTVTIDTFGTGKDNTVNVSGSGSDYLAIAQFVNNLSESADLFPSVSLNSVSLDSQSSQAKFFIVLTVNPEVLKK